MVSTIQLTFGVYLLILLAIGAYFFVTTETNRLSDYLLAGRDVGTWPVAISEVSSVASGWTFFAWVGVGFATGINGLWFSITMILLVIFMYRYVGSRFRRQSEDLGSITIADHLSLAVTNDRLSTQIRVVATLSILVFMGAYIGAQIIAVGEAMDTGIGIDYGIAIAVGGVVVGLYTMLGGFNASVWTDVFQGILIFVAAVTLPILMIGEVGGWSAFVAEAGAVDDAALLDITGGLAGQALLIGTLAWVTFAFGTIGQPHSLMRLQAIRSERLLSPAAVIAVAFQSLRLTVPLLIGAAGRVLYGSVDNPENVAMMAIVDFFPAVVAGVLLAAIVSAILSTSDSMLLVASSDFTRFYEERIDPDASQKTLILLGRATVGVLALGGIALAFVRPGTIFEIIEFAYVGLGATFGLPLLFMLFWERTTGEAILAGIVVGLGSSIGNLYLLPDYFPILVWPVCIAVIVGVTLATAESGADVAGVPEPTTDSTSPADD
ncbi:sodium/proline symporter [Natronococcus sp. A-GB1]|uniref:sodium/proline symporter n=1 Tax=Natronococcus sp. A-GB1 TaxID=3037648 RepID=UPI00241C38CC|nr:sodium/proline symporter [Natronococcus sp. A-GB1]MDG5760642.1 sodium/proline symporter [Natronococcus sp. A-GB1]